jgi:hypothetical protein
LTIPPVDDRRAVPRFKASFGCSVVFRPSDKDSREQAALGYVRDLSREAVAVVLPSDVTSGVDASSLGVVEMNLALPVGYVRLSATLIRYSPDHSGKTLFVFRIQESKERSKYDEYLASLSTE